MTECFIQSGLNQYLTPLHKTQIRLNSSCKLDIVYFSKTLIELQSLQLKYKVLSFSQQKPALYLCNTQNQSHYIFMMWNINSTNLISQYFPFAPYRNVNFEPPYPIPENMAQVFRTNANIEKIHLSVETFNRQTLYDNAVMAERELRFRKAKKKAKTRIIKKKIREETFEKKKQKKDRNLPSNICRFFVSYIYQHPVPRLILGPCPTHISDNIQSCIAQVKNYIKEGQTYVRPSIIEAMCKGKILNAEQSVIIRMLFKRYIKLELKIAISMMRKLKKKQKVSYFRLANRFLKHFICSN